MVGQGVRQIDFVLPEDRSASGILGDGTRWGAQFRYHSAGDHNVYEALAKVPSRDDNEAVLIAHSDRLPLIKLAGITSVPTLFCWRGAKLFWTGWGVIRTADVRRLPPGIDERGLFAFLAEGNGGAVLEEGPRPLIARSYEDLIESNRRVLAREFPGVLVGGKEVQPGVWVARNVALHPTARLEPPAFLGENSRVGALVQVGPSASIGKDCMIERETVVSNSVIFDGSYIGERLALRGVVVDRSRFASTRWGVEIEGMDDLLLGSVFSAPLHARVRRASRRSAAAVALLAASPCLVLMLAASAVQLIPPLRRQLMVRTPTIPEPYRWKTFPLWSFGIVENPAGNTGWVKHFFFCLLPALPSIVAGHIGLAGESAQTKEEIERATTPDRAAYLHRQIGILPLDSLCDALPDRDFAVLNTDDRNWLGTVRILGCYAQVVLRSLFLRTPDRHPK